MSHRPKLGTLPPLAQHPASVQRLNERNQSLISLEPLTLEQRPPSRQSNRTIPPLAMNRPMTARVTPSNRQNTPSHRQELSNLPVLQRPATAAPRVHVPRLKPAKAPMNVPELELEPLLSTHDTPASASTVGPSLNVPNLELTPLPSTQDATTGRSMFSSSEIEVKHSQATARPSFFCWQASSSSSLPSMAPQINAPLLGPENHQQQVPALDMPSNTIPSSNENTSAYNQRLFSHQAAKDQSATPTLLTLLDAMSHP